MSFAVANRKEYEFFYEKFLNFLLLVGLIYQQGCNLVFAFNLDFMPEVEHFIDFIIITSLMFPIQVLSRNTKIMGNFKYRLLKLFDYKKIHPYLYRYIVFGLYLNLTVLSIILSIGIFRQEIELFPYSWILDIFTFICISIIIYSMKKYEKSGWESGFFY